MKERIKLIVKKVDKYNKYIKSLENRDLSAQEHDRIKRYMKREKKRFDKAIKKIRKREKTLKNSD